MSNACPIDSGSAASASDDSSDGRNVPSSNSETSGIRDRGSDRGRGRGGQRCSVSGGGGGGYNAGGNGVVYGECGVGLSMWLVVVLKIALAAEVVSSNRSCVGGVERCALVKLWRR